MISVLTKATKPIQALCKKSASQGKSNKKQTYNTLLVETENNITTVTLNRPSKKNAMSFEMMDELMIAANHIKKDKRVRAVVLKGAGEDFCAGVDLSDLNQPTSQVFALWQLVKPCQSLFQKVCLVWQSLPVPVIANVHGHCLGAGLQLIMGSDIRIASVDSKLAVLEAKWGLVADMGITQSALGSVNVDVLKELAMTARIITAKDAKELGLLTHVMATANEADEKLANILDEIVQRSPDAVLASKRVINSMYQQSACTLYQEKMWQTKLILGKNRKLALKKAKDTTVQFAKRQFG